MTKGPLVLGIDTGGTYTDGVLLDYQSREVLAAHKSLTTKRDFSVGIENVIRQIDIEDPSLIRMVSISTTLATNAIAEGKGKRVALLLIGYDPELIQSFSLDKHFATPEYYYFEGGHDLYGQEVQPLDLPAVLAKVNAIKDTVDALAVSSYFSPLNPEHERRAFSAIEKICDLPVVLGHQLSTKLGSVERATTAALNASLLAVLQDFIVAVRQAMERRNIDAPLMVVRGDGTLMSDEFAARTPVETIHSGPAASAIGGRFLSNLDNALIVDIGGTTTDFALIKNGQVTISEQGATVGAYKTSVKAADLLSIGVGGDSHIRTDHEGNYLIGPQRVVPLSFLAEEHESVFKRLKALSKRTWEQSSPDWLEYWFLLRDPGESHLQLSGQQSELAHLLEEGPLPLPEIVRKLGVLHVNQLNADELFRQEILGRAGLTPTDLLHTDGRFPRWNVEAAEYALNSLCKYQFEDADTIRVRIWKQMTESILRKTLNFLIDLPIPDEKSSAGGLGEWFFQNSLYDLHPDLATSMELQMPIIGIGAPAELLLKDYAEKLHAELVLPDHFHVANAIGAVGGSVMVEEEILVYPIFSKEGLDVIAYRVQSKTESEQVEELEEALSLARETAAERSLSAAIRSGADNPEVELSVENDGIDSYRVRARAMGNPRLMK
ncbi:MAG: hydantoinase/oxoprolinase family protein [Anaerolineales bacterium]|jgi:N-methylhydantoinase A/oxoprolinase/acetone carboxylase beta subunit